MVMTSGIFYNWFLVTYPSNEFWLAVGQCDVLVFLQVVECDAAHGAAVTHVSQGQLQSSNGIRETSLY